MATTYYQGMIVQTPITFETITDEVSITSRESPGRTFFQSGGSHVVALEFVVGEVRGSQQGALALAAHMERHRNGATFKTPMLQPLGFVDPGRVTVSAAAAIGATSLTVDLLRTSTNIQSGVYFTVAGSNKMHQVVVGRIGDGAIEISPGLRVALEANAALDFTPMLNCFYATPRTHTFNRGLRYTKAIRLQEQV